MAWISLACLVVSVASPMTVRAAAPELRVNDACADITWDGATRALSIALQPEQFVGVRPRTADFPDTLSASIGGIASSVSPTVAIGDPVLAVARSGNTPPACAAQTASNGLIRDHLIVPLDQVEVLHITSSATTDPRGVDVRQWAQLAPRLRSGFHVELDSSGAQSPPTLCFLLGTSSNYDCGMAEIYDVPPRVASPPVMTRPVGSNAIDVDGDGDVELSWSGRLASLRYQAGPGADDIDLRGLAIDAVEVRAGGGNDHVAAAGAGAVLGESGDDTIVAFGGVASMLGGPGNDILDASAQLDPVSALGGAGDDRVVGGSGGDTLLGDTGNDVLIGGGGADSLRGQVGNDVLDGGADDDEIEAGKGDDIAWGGDGRDHLTGDVGNDQLHGGNGDDTINPNDGNDLAWGDDGNDMVGFTTKGNIQSARPAGDDDQLWGGPGNDIVMGGGRAERAYGGPGNDVITVDGGVPVVDAGPGNDFVWARSFRGAKVTLGAGNDTLRMGGISVFQVDVGRRTRVSCGAGRDWVDWQAVHVMGCEWQAQRDAFDERLGRPFRDDSTIPRAPEPPRDVGPSRPGRRA